MLVLITYVAPTLLGPTPCFTILLHFYIFTYFYRFSLNYSPSSPSPNHSPAIIPPPPQFPPYPPSTSSQPSRARPCFADLLYQIICFADDDVTTLKRPERGSKSKVTESQNHRDVSVRSSLQIYAIICF